MKVILLAGGYATRLWPLTKDTPKALLEVGEKSILEHVLHIIEHIKSAKQVYLTTNQKFEPNFRAFLRKWKGAKKVELIVEKSTSNDEKYGAVGALLKMQEDGLLEDSALILAADNVFDSHFADMLNAIIEKGEDALILYDVEKGEAAKLYGVCETNSDGYVVDFEEKPKQPRGTLVSTGCYFLRRETLDMLAEYERLGGGTDRIGDFIKWLVYRGKVRGYVYSGRWFDIGTHEHLDRARKAHGKK
ncbi:MAG: nucleotidyltransferase family protein [Candidatus Micrarchaeia archaeon]|jgi:glucose-1-phosphate thymidylyltransferase